MSKALHIIPGLFGPPMVLGNLRMGDLIACCNFLEYIREKTEHHELKMFFEPDCLYPSTHVFKMHQFLINHTNYVAAERPETLVNLPVIPGTDPTYSSMYNLWNIRENVKIRRQNVFDIPDRVNIVNMGFINNPNHAKIVIAPLMDAPYNAHRNWPLEYVQKIVDYYKFHIQVESIIICREPIYGLDIRHFKYSHDFNENLKHVMECTTFHGGDTGFSHFASVLIPGPSHLNYHYSQETYGTTYPFYWKTEGRIIEFDKPPLKLNNGLEINDIFYKP